MATKKPAAKTKGQRKGLKKAKKLQANKTLASDYYLLIGRK